ncbi:NADH-quinone oxidoreductase subunit J [Roseiterribacter gracilis]|uniref:NADH-quinone oxidoreductase subunit J n=1 Tax=Roseiterribacter gracilis TaxID=2812848 RepID=A0A8S8X5P0_9PROT|nr:NADH:ubiquinone oxidoreductase subunit J [Rhodospirillales bacterium TMPK1]
MYEAIAFYGFSAILLLAAVLVIVSRNPVHSVLWLILAFFNAAGLFVLLGAEFVAMILVIVYVGAVAVLFLFVVMMLDVDLSELRAGFAQYLPLGVLIGVVLLVELIFFVISGWTLGPALKSAIVAAAPDAAQVSNTRAIGRLLYTDYVFVFQGAGMVLLVAMIGAIVLTLRQRPGVRKQNIAAQVSRQRGDTVTLHKVETGAGA